MLPPRALCNIRAMTLDIGVAEYRPAAGRKLSLRWNGYEL